MSINGWRYKQNMAYSYSRILSSLKKEGTSFELVVMMAVIIV